MDEEGRTPLIRACTRGDSLENILKLLNSGEDLNSYRPGSQCGTPLHHAAKGGHDKIVALLLYRGANPLVTNDDGETPLQMARTRGHVNVVRLIEGWISLFCERILVYSSQCLWEELLTEWLPKSIWAVVLPSASNNPRRPPRFELVIYPNRKVSQPSTIISLSEIKIKEPKFILGDPTLVLFDKSTKTKYEFLSATGDINQMQRLYEACKGTHQQHISAPLPEEVQLAIAIDASLRSLAEERIPFSGAPQQGSLTSEFKAPAPPLPEEYRVGSDASAQHSTSSNKSQGNTTGSCVICWDAPAEAVCVPCGHIAGCMACLNHVKGKKIGCPFCRASIKQVVKVYPVGLDK